MAQFIFLVGEKYFPSWKKYFPSWKNEGTV